MNSIEPRERLDLCTALNCRSPQASTALMRIALIGGAKVRTDKLQPVIDAALLIAEPWLRTLMKDARGGLIR